MSTKSARVHYSSYGVLKALPSNADLEDDDSEVDEKLSLRIQVRPEPYHLVTYLLAFFSCV